ncbi:MAG: hypothetical protein A2V70_20820 [Planctomycetes bacterium RBG_13_63_9]|nr:MAG: hypothetical protein A2V70_20820 [Planctomycetes bacterium RBG_13_63_9]
MLVRRSLQLMSWLTLAGTILPSCFFLAGRMELEPMKTAMLAATAGWFVATPLWMHRKPNQGSVA